MSVPSLGKTFSQGVAWFYLLRFGSRIIASLQLVILARLLTPEDFGLIGSAMLVLSLLQTFSATGFNQALVVKKQDISAYLDTVWWVEVGRGIAIGLIVFLMAPLAASFFKEPETLPILRALAIYPFVTSLASPGLIQLDKALRFKRLVLFQGVLTILGLIVSIASALIFRNVWALVIGTLFGGILMSFGSYFIYPYRPGMGFAWHKARELWDFGRWVLGNKIAHYLFNDGDDWVVSRLLGSEALGLYQMAYNLGNAPSTEVTAIFSRVALPVFSKIQYELPRMRRAYLRLLQTVMFVSTPVSLGIALVAQDVVIGFMGEKWAPMIRSLQILLIWGWIRSFRATTGPLLQARGRPDVVAKFTLFKVIILALLVIPFSLRWNIEGTSWVVVIAAVSEIPLLLISMQRVAEIAPKEILARLLHPLFTAIPMVATVLIWQNMIYSHGSWIIRLIVSILLGAAAYIPFTIWLDKSLGWGLRADFQSAIGHNLRPLMDSLAHRRQPKSATTPPP